MDRITLDAIPALEDALPGLVVERPVHRDALDVDFLAIVAMLKNLRRVAVGITRLDRVPPQLLPVIVGFLAARLERLRAAVE